MFSRFDFVSLFVIHVSLSVNNNRHFEIKFKGKNNKTVLSMTSVVNFYQCLHYTSNSEHFKIISNISNILHNILVLKTKRTLSIIMFRLFGVGFRYFA